MAIASITAWLNNPDKNYHHGRLLYEQYGSSKVILALIKSGTGNYHFNKLVAALTELNKQSNLEPKQIAVSSLKSAPTAPDPMPKPADNTFINAPDKILEIRDRKNKQYAQARHLHQSICFLDTPKLRLQAALQLLDIMDEVNEAWSIIDEWREKGQIREQEQQKQVAEVATMSQMELFHEEKRLAPNISKDRGKLSVAKDDRTILKITERLQARELRLAEVRRRLNEFV